MNSGGSGWLPRDFSQNQTGRILRSLAKLSCLSVRWSPKASFHMAKCQANSCFIKRGRTLGSTAPLSIWADLWGATSGLLFLPRPWFHLFPGPLTLRICFCLCLPGKLKFPGPGSGLPCLTLHYTSSNVQL